MGGILGDHHQFFPQFPRSQGSLQKGLKILLLREKMEVLFFNKTPKTELQKSPA